jgi:hypothetical protein
VSNVVPFYRSDTPGLDDAAGGEGPPPEGESDPLSSEHELLTKALRHATKCMQHIERSLGEIGEDDKLLDDEPLFEDDPFNADSGNGPEIGYDDDVDRRARRYARASNI